MIRRCGPVLVCLLLTSLASAEDSALAGAVAGGDLEAVEARAGELASAGGAAKLEAVLDAIAPKVRAPVYWALVRAAASFRDAAALTALGEQLVDLRDEPLAGDLMFSLQSNPAPAVVTPLLRVLEAGAYPLQLMAASQLAFVREPAAVDGLLAAWRREDDETSDLCLRIQGALVTLTGEAHATVHGFNAWWSKTDRTLASHDRQAERPRDREFQTVERGVAERIVVLSGDRSDCPDAADHDRDDLDFDKIEWILERRNVPHTVVPKWRFEQDPRAYLQKCHALLLNCSLITSYCNCGPCTRGVVSAGGTENRLSYHCDPNCDVHEMVSRRLSKGALKQIERWVERDGGYLFTEDWGLVEVLGLLWPKHVDSGTRTRDEDGLIADEPILVRGVDDDGATLEWFRVGLRPGRGQAAHPLMRGVWHDPERTGTASYSQHRWRIDDESPAIEIKHKDVVTLLESPWLERHFESQPAVAVTFRPGSKSRLRGTSRRATGEWALARSGRVLHTMSHLGKQSSSEDGAALENLLINFLLEAERRAQR